MKNVTLRTFLIFIILIRGKIDQIINNHYISSQKSSGREMFSTSAASAKRLVMMADLLLTFGFYAARSSMTNCFFYALI